MVLGGITDKYIIITFKKRNRNTIINYLEKYFRKNELLFAHRFETNAAPETIVCEAQKDANFNNDIETYVDNGICNYVVINKSTDKSIISKTLPRVFRIDPSSLFEVISSLIDKLSQ